MARFDFNFEDKIPEGGPLSGDDMAQLERQLDPANMISAHQTKQADAGERIQQLKMQRLREENEALLAATQAQTVQSQQQSERAAYLQGQVEALKTQANSAPRPDEQFDEEELATHGHAKGFVSKVAKIETRAAIDQLKAEMAQQYQQQLADLDAKYQAQLAAQSQELNNIHGTIKNNFDAEIRKAATDMGLNFDALLAGDPAFMAFAARPLAIGSPKMWGTQLEENIDAQNPNATIAMFQQYAEHLQQKPRVVGTDVDNQELPASSGARPLSPQVQQNLTTRQRLMARADEIQDQFLQGTYPGTQEEYQIEKAKLLEQADDIPLPV